MTSAADGDGAAGVPSPDLDVQVQEVTKQFGDLRAVDGASIEVAAGSFFSLLGPSGSGKTTLLRLLAGFEVPDSGRILIAGRDVTRTPPSSRPTALVFQRWALFPHMSALDNVVFGLRARRRPRAESTDRALDLLALVGLEGLHERKPGQLSGGQQQRVALARALAIRPRVLLLDEPLASLDLKLRVQMQIELKRLQREVGTTFVFVTHDQGEAMAMSDRIAVVNRGRIEQVGPPADVYDRPTTAFVADFIGDGNLLDVEPDGRGGVRYQGLDLVPPAGASITDGVAYALSLRCERVEVGERLTVANHLRGRVHEVVFGGRSVRYTVAVDGSDLEITADVPHTGALQYARGDVVEVGWAPDSAVLVPR